MQVNDIDTLQSYMEGVLRRAGHHAEDVDAAAVMLIGCIVWKKDRDQPIKVLSRNGNLGNVLWVYIKGTRYAFTYNHETCAIECKTGSLRGDVSYQFDNSMLDSIKDVFEKFLG